MTHPTPNFASKVIQPEKVELNTDYTITINPCDSRQYWNQKDRIECVSRDMALIIGQVSADWTVYLETSSVGGYTGTGRISFQTYSSVKEFYVNHIHRIMSTNNIEIDVINDEEIWDTYMKKQEYLMKTKLDNDKADKMNKKVVHQSK